MKFVYFGYDMMLGCARRLIADGHQLAGIFTFPCDNVFNFNIETVALARQLGPGKRIVTILCDTGFRYLSTLYNPEWLKAKGLA